jgi:MraZ protein
MKQDGVLEPGGATDKAAEPAPLFQGEYTHTLDAKGRITIPVCFRDLLAQGMQITRGYEPCIVVYTLAEWDAFAANAARLPQSHKSARSIRRIVFSGGVKVVPDGMGRILLPEYLRIHAGISGQAVFLGVDNNIEIWNPATWQSRLAEDMAHIDEINAEIAKLGM